MENEKHVIFEGNKYRWDGRYYFPCKGTKAGKRLHVAVWEHFNGLMPKGCEIHHRDHDRRNNDIENLECLTIAEHRKHHASDKPTKRKLEHLEKIRPKAADWHRSSEGRKWHSEHAARQIKSRDPHTRTCQACNKEFLTKSFKAKYCSNNCKARGRRQQLKDLIDIKCKICGGGFLTNKYQPAKTCSKPCATKLVAISKGQ